MSVSAIGRLLTTARAGSSHMLADQHPAFPKDAPSEQLPYPFNAPTVMPRKKYFWSARKRMMVGIAVKSDPAIKRP